MHQAPKYKGNPVGPEASHLGNPWPCGKRKAEHRRFTNNRFAPFSSLGDDFQPLNQPLDQSYLTQTQSWTQHKTGRQSPPDRQAMETGHGNQESSWLGGLMDYAMLSSEHPTIVRYISGFFQMLTGLKILLGFLFVLPAVFLILLDIVLWVGRTFWISVVRWDESPEQLVEADREVSNTDLGSERAVEDADAPTAVQPPDGSQAVRRREAPAIGERNNSPMRSWEFVEVGSLINIKVDDRLSEALAVGAQTDNGARDAITNGTSTATTLASKTQLLLATHRLLQIPDALISQQLACHFISPRPTHIAMPQDPNLYGQPPPKKRKNNITLSSSLDFTAQLTSLISNPSSPSASNTSAARPRPSKQQKDDIFSSHKPKSRASSGKKRASEDDNKLVLKNAPAQDEAETLARARRKMEEKARLYAAMKRGDYVAKENEQAPLIDFDRKWAEGEAQRRDTGEASSSGTDDDDDSDSGGDDEDKAAAAAEIIEYEDEFGRLRRGTRAEIARLERQHRRGLLSAEELERMSARPAAPENLIRGDAIQTLAFAPEDAEKMQELAARRDRSPTPPEAKRYDADSEVRVRGTGFYKFSKDEETRAEEMRSLDEERRRTEDKRGELDHRKAARRREIEERRRNLEERRAKRMADSFLEGLAADIGSTENEARDEKGS
ncbi:hypothetical protein ACRALDRAFT_1093951 [Sodiomyces alcalophilus JCM 7366]|uniref:uncharacterized protein n=1 Tax=Sodiomyces alcalophilus JCM 7366 TaxID=591952 RepID=UPI0039B424E9